MHSFTVLEEDLLVPICNTNKGKISDLNRHVRVLEETLKARVSFFLHFKFTLQASEILVSDRTMLIDRSQRGKRK